MRHPTRRLLLAALLLVSPPFPALALLDVPTSERGALTVSDLASGSGIARPADPALGPLDDLAYLEGYRALKARGLVDPLGERLDRWEAARSRGDLLWDPLLPVLTARPYVLDSDGAPRALHHSSGDLLEDGFNAFFSASGAAFWGQRVAGAYELRLQERPGDWSYRTKRLYLKGVWGRWSLKAGRDSERLGPGYHGSLLLDDTAPTMDLWRVRTEEPLFFPGRLGAIGGFRFALFHGYLSDESPGAPDPRFSARPQDAPVEDPRLLGLRLSYHPTPWLDLGASRTALYGGEGRDRSDGDRYLALDLTARLPFLEGLGPMRAGKVYWEHAGTDLAAAWQGEDPGGLLPFSLRGVANLGGIYLSTAVTELRFEFAQTGASWYRDDQYAQGYTYRGRPLGHHMGGDARNWFVEVARHFGPAWRASLALDLEERGRSLAREEERAEWSLSLEARELGAGPVPLQARLDLLTADVDAPLDDSSRRDRREWYGGLSLACGL